MSVSIAPFPMTMNRQRVARVLLGAAASVSLMVLGLHWLLDARQLISLAASRPAFIELSYRFGGVSLWAAAQALAVLLLLPALYRRRRGDLVLAAALAMIFLAAGLTAVVFALSGR